MYNSRVHPDRTREFRASAPPKFIIKQGRKATQLACTNCGRPDDEDGVKLKHCSECQAAQYCSREVGVAPFVTRFNLYEPSASENSVKKKTGVIASRPIHKDHCDPSLEGGIQPLIKSITGNPMIAHYIQICISYEYRLHELEKIMTPEKRKAFIRSPLGIHIDVGIEPTQITDFMNFYTYKEEWDKEDMEGMMQLHHLSSFNSGLQPEMVFTPAKTAMWKYSRQQADEDGLQDSAVVMVLFVNNFKQAIASTMIISQTALNIAREAEPFKMCSALTGKTTVHPMGVTSCLEYINTHIRADTTNHLLLRRPIREADKELIRDAGRREKDSHSIAALRFKIRREHVYQSHAVHVVVHPGGSSEDENLRFVGVSRDEVDRINDECIESMRAAREGEGDPEPVQDLPPRNRAERRRMEREMKKALKKKGG